MHRTNMKTGSSFSPFIALLLGVIGSVAQAGPMTAGQTCTAGSPAQGCVPGNYCLNLAGSPAFGGGGKCYPPGVPLGTYESYSPTQAQIAAMMPVNFLTLGTQIQTWLPVQIQAVSGGMQLAVAVPGMTPGQIQSLTQDQRKLLATAIPQDKWNAWVQSLSAAQRQALGL